MHNLSNFDLFVMLLVALFFAPLVIVYKILKFPLDIIKQIPYHK